MMRGPLLAAALALGLAACTSEPTPEPTPAPTTFPVAGPDAASTVASRFVAAWSAGDWPAMHALLDPATQERYPLDGFAELHASFARMTVAGEIRGETGAPRTVGLAPEPPPAEFPAPTPIPSPSPVPDATPATGASPTPAPAIDPETPLEGPVPALAVPLGVRVETERFGSLALDRALTFVHGRDGWQLRWTPEVLFPELGADGRLRLDRSLAPRGRILGPDDQVWADANDDGIRIYPQGSLAGQVIGYVSEVTAEDLERLPREGGYRAGDVVGRSGLEYGAEALLRGTPGWSLVAVGDEGTTVLRETESVPGADIVITIRPELQAVAQRAIAPYAQAATAVVDPRSGDVWALASAPFFDPNAMTLGSSLDGRPLEPAGQAQVFNKAVLGAYPAGSSFKPFTLAAALKTEVVTPSSTRPCPPTWQYGTFTFRNYMDHQLPGQVGLAESMAFSCNTTYMPLAYEVYEVDETAFTDLLSEFGFGRATGIGYLVEETGIVPDDAWLAANGRGWYSGFEQIQLSIGQGAFLGTPLQLANAYAAIGNGGTLWRPRIVTQATLPDGTRVEEVEPTVASEISLSEADLAFVTDTLEAVVTLPYGTGTAAFGDAIVRQSPASGQER